MLEFIKPAVNSPSTGVLGIMHVRNEMLRMEGVLDHHRRLGVEEFLVVDNGSTDGTREYLEAQPDVNLFFSEQPYSQGKYGLDATNALLNRHGEGRWCLTIDADEYFVYPHCENKRLPLFVKYLERQGAEAVLTILLDMYSARSIAETEPEPGRSLWQVCPHFDGDPYSCSKADLFPFVQIVGGPRRRVFWDRGSSVPPPTVNKVPLVKWRKGYRYASSTHFLKPGPARLAEVSGALLHFKFLSDFHHRAAHEAERQEHFHGAREYKKYIEKLAETPSLSLFYEGSRKYNKSTDLVQVGLIQNSPAWSFFL